MRNTDVSKILYTDGNIILFLRFRNDKIKTSKLNNTISSPIRHLARTNKMDSNKTKTKATNNRNVC